MIRWLPLAFVLAVASPAFAQEKKEAKDEGKDYLSDADAKKHIEEWQKAWKKCKGLDDQIRSIEDLGAKKHPKILDELKKHLGSGSLEVRITAADMIGKYKKEDKAADALFASAKGCCNRKETMELAVKSIRYLGNTGVRTKVKEMLPFFDHKETDFAKEAIDTAGALKSKDAIDPLVNMVLFLEAVKEDTNNGNTGGQQLPGGQYPGANQPGGQQEDEKVKRKKELLNPAIQALKDITGEKLNTGTEWKRWWGKNKATFKELEDK